MLGIAFGTRPEFIKLKPIIEELKRQDVPFRLIFTGQHEDLIDEKFDSDVLQFKIDPPYREENRLNNIVQVIMDYEWHMRDFTAIMVQGDTTSAFTVALAAFHRKIPVIHLEAGLRTWDIEQPYPEEANRQMISVITDVHLCPTTTAVKNLSSDSGRTAKVNLRLVGNTVLDNIRDVKTSDTNKVLVTLHRRENHDIMDQWFQEIEKLAGSYSELEFILPIHPNPNVLKHRHLLTKVKIIDPLPHDELIEILASCKAVITDSGGIQEEAAFLRKFCVVCRKKTERVEGLDNFSLLCCSPDKLNINFLNAMKLPMSGDCPYGDGKSSQRIVQIIKNL